MLMEYPLWTLVEFSSHKQVRKTPEESGSRSHIVTRTDTATPNQVLQKPVGSTCITTQGRVTYTEHV
jgi:hypothetical protein